MNPKHLSVRMDRDTGALWLTEECILILRDLEDRI